MKPEFTDTERLDWLLHYGLDSAAANLLPPVDRERIDETIREEMNRVLLAAVKKP